MGSLQRLQYTSNTGHTHTGSTSNVKSKKYFSTHLLEWFRTYQRDLPWRRTKNPYHIWVSEIMLQQTRVDTVIPYFHRFIEKFPTIEALADAPEEDVLKTWEGLGYYSRARNLQTAVREVAEHYGGKVPEEKEDISSLKGVGPYTAGAILSIAFNKPEPAVDGNVMRVLSRYFLIEEDITKGSTRVYMENLIRELIPEGAAADFNQALMELGALVCTPRSPHCLTCPVMEHCAGRIEGMEEALPIKKKAKPPRPEYRLAAIIKGSGDKEGKFLIRQRTQDGLLAKMWELPHFEIQGQSLGWNVPDEQSMDLLRNSLSAEDGIRVMPAQWFMNAEHTFSHIHWNLRVYECSLDDEGTEKAQSLSRGTLNSQSPQDPKGPQDPQGPQDCLPEHYRWMDASEMDKYAFPNVFLRIIRQFFAEGEEQ